MLTDAQIRALKPAATRYMTTDGRGLSIDILPSGIMTWLFRYRLNGIQEKLTLGRYPDLSLAGARKERDRLAQLVAAGKSPSQQKRQARAGRSTDPTVRSFGNRYYDEQIAGRLKDPSEIRRYLDNEIYPHLGDRQLREVGVLDIQRVIYRKRDKGRVVTALRMRQVLKGLYDYALEVRLVESNPATQCATRYIGKTKKRTRALSPNEIRIFLRTVYAADIQRQFKLALHMTLATLTRKSELRLTEWEHVNFDAGVWVIPAQNTKTNSEHVVYLCEQTASMFRELQTLSCGSKFVLPGRTIHRPMNETTLNGALERVTFDLAPFVIHDLRRSASTLLHSNGFQPDVIETALGHQIGGVRGVYNVALYVPERKKMLAWWSTYIDSLLNESNIVIGNFGSA